MSHPLSHLPWIKTEWFLGWLRAAGQTEPAARPGGFPGTWQQPQAGLAQGNVATGGNSYRLALPSVKTLPTGTSSGKSNGWTLEGGECLTKACHFNIINPEFTETRPSATSLLNIVLK